MTKKHLTLVLIATSLAAADIRAQTPPVKELPPLTQMYENVEIMRRLLDDKVQTHYPPLIAAGLNGNRICASCHQVAKPLPEVFPSLFRPATVEPTSDSTWQHLFPRDQWHGMLLDHVHGKDLMPITEGVYLKGQGVVFTMTLPPSEQNPSTLSLAPDKKPMSDWERMRRQVRQEEPSDDEKKRPHDNPSLAEVLLHVLAGNGAHFAQLGDGEALTVVVTFRAPDARAGSGTNVPKDRLRNFLPSDSGAQPAPRDPRVNQDALTQTLTYLDKPKNSADEYELLGDLHRKQGKIEDALTAYRKALELSPSDARWNVVLLIKIAESLKEQNKDKEALATLQKATDWLKSAAEKGSQGPTESGRPPMPNKLIVSASKRLLEQVDAGKISFDEFARAASVEMVTFSGSKR
jgi:hypothetical protein